MTLDALSPTAALVVVDLQIGTTSSPLAHPADEIIGRAAQLATAWRDSGRPVVLATVDGTPSGRTVSSAGGQSWPEPFATLRGELGASPDDLLVRRRTWSAFAGTDLHERLGSLGVTQIVLVGVATSFGVESTARAAYDLGYDVVIVGDAVTDRSLDSHEHAVSRVFPALGVVSTTSEVTAALAA